MPRRRSAGARVALSVTQPVPPVYTSGIYEERTDGPLASRIASLRARQARCASLQTMLSSARLSSVGLKMTSAAGKGMSVPYTGRWITCVHPGSTTCW